MKTGKKNLASLKKSPADVKRILIIKPSSLGDIFHAFPAVARLHELFPNAEFDWLVHPAFADALDYSPVPVKRKIIFRRRELGKISTMLPAMVELIRELRENTYDYIFDFQGLFRSAFFARMAKGRVVGFARPREAVARWFYHSWSKVNLRLHAVRRNQLLVERFFQTGTMRTDTVIPSNADNAALLENKLRQLGIAPDDVIVGVSPGARWESKAFPPELFARVMILTAEMNSKVKFVIMGAPADQKLAENILSLSANVPAVSLAGATSLGELVELIKRSKVLLANDSGPVHIAASAKVPVVCFYGPTNPNLTGPFGDIHTIFQRGDLKCIKCMNRQCRNIVTECHDIDAAAAAAAICKKLQE